MQQHPRPTRPQHNLHLPRRCIHCSKLQHRSPSCLARKMLRALISLKEIHRHAATAPAGAASLCSRHPSRSPFNRASGCVSLANVPSDAATRIRRSSSLKPARTCVIRESYARAALSARSIKDSLAAIKASLVAPAIGYSDGAASGLRNPLINSFAGPLAIKAAVRAARSSRSLERSSVYAYPVRSPETTRTPQPTLMPWLAVFTSPSSTPRDVEVTGSK